MIVEVSAILAMGDGYKKDYVVSFCFFYTIAAEVGLKSKRIIFFQTIKGLCWSKNSFEIYF